MRKIHFFILLLLYLACNQNSTNPEPNNLSASDIIPLNDSTRQLYYNDAVYIEYMRQADKEHTLSSSAVLDEFNIGQYYNDLINIYQSSYKINKRFLDNITRIHNHYHYGIRQIHVAVDTNKIWVKNWLNDKKIADIAGIDSIIYNYELDILESNGSKNRYNFTLTSANPINNRLLAEKLSATDEFLYAEIPARHPDWSSISMQGNQDYKNYIFKYGWGDCPSGCIYQHTWEIKVKGEQISLNIEYGDALE